MQMKQKQDSEHYCQCIPPASPGNSLKIYIERGGRNESRRILNLTQQSNEGKFQDDSCSSSLENNHVSVQQEEQKRWSQNEGRLGRFAGIPEVEVKVFVGRDKGTQYKAEKLETR